MHNWLRLLTVDDRQYESSVDVENLESGEIIEGGRRSSQQPLGLLSLHPTLAHHSNQQSQEFRKKLADYFVGEGSVPWQLRMIH